MEKKRGGRYCRNKDCKIANSIFKKKEEGGRKTAHGRVAIVPVLLNHAETVSSERIDPNSSFTSTM